MQGAQNLRSEAHLLVRCNDEGEAQRRRWTFYETITFNLTISLLGKTLLIYVRKTPIVNEKNLSP